MIIGDSLFITYHLSLIINSMRKFFINWSLAAVSFVSLLTPLIASAQCSSPNDPLGLSCAGETGLTATDPRLVVGRIINVALGLLGTIAVALIIFAGFRWMTAGGNEDGVKQAQQILFAAVIGLVIILSAYAISNFVLKQLYGATQGVQYGGEVL